MERENKVLKKDLTVVRGQVIAHRGLFSRELPENSLGAFSLAMEKGFDIELDVHLTKDNGIAVFHDNNLLRMCGNPRRVSSLLTEDLKGCYLKGTKESIPTFDEVLKKIQGKVALFVELKGVRLLSLADALIEKLADYNGAVAFHGFDAVALSYLSNKGYVTLLSCFSPKIRKVKRYRLDGVAPMVSRIPKKDYNGLVIAWTVKNEEQKELCALKKIACFANITTLCN